MSYILDALRRADSERERERATVPDLHAQPMLSTSLDEADAPRPGLMRWIAGGAVLLVAAALAWTLWGRDAPREPAPPPPAPMPAPAPATMTAAPMPAPPPPLAANAVPQPAAKALPPPPEPPRPARVAAARAAQAEPAPSAAPSEDTRLYKPAEMPEHIRRELPQLAIGGSVYSQNAANRMLILNGQVFREGDKPTADLQLEQIRLKSAVFKFKGYRYEVDY